jgi:hypothetical protein
MALTFTKQYFGVVGDRKCWRGTVTFDSSYPTGGEAVTAANFEFTLGIETVIIGSNDEAGVSARWDSANSKIKLFDENDTSGIEAEFANAGDASGNVVTLEAYGK